MYLGWLIAPRISSECSCTEAKKSRLPEFAALAKRPQALWAVAPTPVKGNLVIDLEPDTLIDLWTCPAHLAPASVPKQNLRPEGLVDPPLIAWLVAAPSQSVHQPPARASAFEYELFVEIPQPAVEMHLIGVLRNPFLQRPNVKSLGRPEEFVIDASETNPVADQPEQLGRIRARKL